MLMLITIILLTITLAGVVYVWYKDTDKLIDYKIRLDSLSKEYITLKKNYKAMEQHSSILYWFSLLRNPNRGKIIIAGPIEGYGTGDNCSTALYATMYGDGHLCASYTVYSSDSSLSNKSRKINREPDIHEELEFFFGKDADWLWAYYEFYRDFVKVREHPVSKIQAQKEIKTHVGKNLDNEVTALLRRLSKGACIYLSSAVVLETVKHKGKKCLEISGLEGEYRQEVLYRGGTWIDINGKEHILVEKNTALLSVMKYLLDKLKVLNIYDTPVREL